MPTKTPLPIGPNIRSIRELRGMTQKALAQAIGINGEESGSAMISRIESGVHSPTLSTLERIAEALEVSPTWLLAQPAAGTQNGSGKK